MPRNRVIYQNEALYVGPSPATSGHYKFVTGALVNAPTQKLNQLDPLSTRTVVVGGTPTGVTLNQMTAQLQPNLANLDRVQNINYNFNVARTDVNQFGNLAAVDRIIINQPTIGLDFNYLQNGFKNEKELGFTVTALKKSAVANVTIKQPGLTFSVSGVSITDGGQGYLNSFTMTLPGTPAAVLRFGVPSGGPFAGQVTGAIIIDEGEFAPNLMGVSILAQGTYQNVNINTGFNSEAAATVFSPTLGNNYPEGTGIVLSISCLSGILTKKTDEKNFFVRTVSEGNDVSVANTGTLNQAIIGIGNCVINNYTINAAVGDLPSVSVATEGRNFAIVTGANDFKLSAGPRYPLPSLDSDGQKVNGTYSLPDFNGRTNLDYAVSAFKPGNIILDLGNFYTSGLGIDTRTQSLNAQNFSLNIPLNRESLNRLGSTFSFAKEISFPISYNFSVDVLVSELATGNLIDVVNNKDIKFDASIAFIKPGTERSALGRVTGVKYTIKSTQLESIDFNSSIGANKTATLTFGGQMGSPEDNTKGIIMQGDYWLQKEEVL